MNQLHDFSLKITALATVRNTIIAVVLFLIFHILLGKVGSQISQNQYIFGCAFAYSPHILDFAFAYSPDTAYNDYLSQYTDAGRAAYKTMVGIDMFYPIAYATLMAFIMSFILKNTRFYTFNLLPFFAVFFDYFENTGIFAMLLAYPEKCYFWAVFASVFGATKWICIGTSFIVYFIFLFKKTTQKTT
jgi:hypothetical protein